MIFDNYDFTQWFLFLLFSHSGVDVCANVEFRDRGWQKPLYQGTTPLREGLAHPQVVRVLLELRNKLHPNGWNRIRLLDFRLDFVKILHFVKRYGADPNALQPVYNSLRQNEKGVQVHSASPLLLKKKWESNYFKMPGKICTTTIKNMFLAHNFPYNFKIDTHFELGWRFVGVVSSPQTFCSPPAPTFKFPASCTTLCAMAFHSFQN